ncbi:MAG: CBS domain-containing protein [Deltaproteobacteria bacterium]|nr:CBS domain-containing protein [Deltaproteobacteria bacterium]
MKVVFGHSNMDLDCFGSIALLKYLHPDYQPVQSQLIHPIAKNLYNLYQNRFGFVSPKDLKDQEIEAVIVVDTRSKSRVKEYFKWIKDFKGPVQVYDHHPSDHDDIEGAQFHIEDYGANTTIIGLELMKKKVRIDPEDATIALTAIYSDTGNFQHENVKKEDFSVASYLLENNASLKLARTFLRSLKEKYQVSLFHDMLNRLTHKNINGHFIVLSYIEIDDNVGGLAAVTEKIFEIEQSEAIFSVFYFKNRNNALIVARSNKDNIRVDRVMAEFGGGGHAMASSALVKDQSGMMVFARLEEHLKKVLQPAVVAEDIMITAVDVIKDSMTLLDASIFLENVSHTGAPVLSDRGEIVGFMTLRDIQKARKANQMHASVRGFMTSNVITATKDLTIREISEILFQNNIGHLPIAQGKSLIGMITRADYLRFMEMNTKSHN